MVKTQNPDHCVLNNRTLNVSLLDIVIVLYMLEEQLRQVLVWFVNLDTLHYGAAVVSA